MDCCFSSICPNDLITSEYAQMNSQVKKQQNHHHLNHHHHHYQQPQQQYRQDKQYSATEAAIVYDPSEQSQLNSSTCSSSSSSSTCSELDLDQIKSELMAAEVAAATAVCFDADSFCPPSTSDNLTTNLVTSSLPSAADADIKHPIITASSSVHIPTHLYQIQNINLKPVCFDFREENRIAKLY